MTVTINGSGSITGVSTMGTTVVNQTLTTPTITSTMGVGNATPAASGAGITFPATQSASTDANTLDDYEEGTWSPTFTYSTTLTSTNPVSTYTVAGRGHYVKIGKVVQFSVYLAQTDITGSEYILSTISGLPFTSQNVSGYQAAVSCAAYLINTIYSGSVITNPYNNCNLGSSSTSFTTNFANDSTGAGYMHFKTNSYATWSGTYIASA